MSLVHTLLQAMVHADGEAIVMHSGDKPFIVTPTGQVDASTRALTPAALNDVLAQILPHDSQSALDEFGAVQYHVPSIPELPNERFTVVAARAGDDVWVEIRRRRVPEQDAVPEEAFWTSAPRKGPESSGEDALTLPDADHLWPETSGMLSRSGTPNQQ